MKVPTKATDGTPNGYLIPIWNALESPNLRPDQVYLTVIAPGAIKGPHLHMRRRGLFCCVKGIVAVVTKEQSGYRETLIGGEDGDVTVLVTPGTPCALVNVSKTEEALILNMPSPAWSKEDPDDWPVENWNYKP